MNRQALFIKALAGRADVYHIAGELKRSRADFEKVLKLTHDYDYKRDTLAGLSWLYSELDDYDQELSCANRLIRITRDKDLCSRGKALIKKAGALRDKGNYVLSLKIAKKSIHLYRLALKDAKGNREERQKIQVNISDAYNTMGMVYNLLGKYGPALAFFKKSLEIVKKINNEIAITQSLNNIGLIYWHMTKFKNAKIYFNKSLDIAQKIGYKSVLSTIYGNIGLIYNEMEKPHIAIGYFQKAIKTGEEIGNKTSTANNMNNAALYYAGIYDSSNAIKYFTLSLNIFQKINNKFGTALVLNNIATIYFNKGEYKKALAYEKEAETIAKRAKMTEIIIRCWTLKARIYGARKKYAKSIELFNNTIALAEKNKMEYLRMTTVIHYVNSAIKEKNKNHLAGISKYIMQLENSFKKASDDYYKCLVLSTLLKFSMVEKKYGEARGKFSALSSIVKRSGDKRFIAETLLIQAQLNIVAGKKFNHLIMKAKKLAKETGLNYLADEIKKIMKQKK